MGTSWNQIVEDAIVGKVITALVDDGYRVEISDQDGAAGVFVYAAADGGKKPRDGYKFWARLRPGNGVDVLFDYTTNLEDTLKHVNAFADTFRE